MYNEVMPTGGIGGPQHTHTLAAKVLHVDGHAAGPKKPDQCAYCCTYTCKNAASCLDDADHVATDTEVC